MPSAPSGISSVSAASGPYAAELRASRPKMGMPAAGPMHSPPSSAFASGLPISRSRKDTYLYKHGGGTANVKLTFEPVVGRVAELADAPDSKSGEVHSSCGFDPHLGHQDQSHR